MVEEFDFVNDTDADETATSGNLDETATSGNLDEIPEEPSDPLIHQGLTAFQIREAQRLAGSSVGLDINKFIKNNNIQTLDVDQLLAFKVPTE